MKSFRLKNIRSIQDGISLFIIISHFEPEKVDFSSINKDNRAQNMRNGYTMLINDLEVPPLLEFSDTIDTKISERALTFFVIWSVTFLQKTHISGYNVGVANDENLVIVKS